MKNLIISGILLWIVIPIYAQYNFPDESRELTCKHSHLDNVQHDYMFFRSANELLDQYDMKFLFLDLSVNDNNLDISGSATLQSIVVAPVIDTFALELVPEMLVDSALINGITATAILRQGDDLLLPLDFPLNSGDQITVSVYYHGTAPQGSGFWAGVSTDSSETWGSSVTWTLSEPYQAKEWWPTKQDLNDKIDSTWIFLTTESENMAVSQGLLTGITPMPDNNLRYEWRSNYPIAYYLVSFAVADYQEYNIYAHPEGYPDSILIQNFIYDHPDVLNVFKEDIDRTILFLEFFSDRYGIYPFAEEKYGHAQTQIPGGMEHQTLTTIISFPFTLVAHEIGHQWFGDNVTCATWSDIWINEGFATYSEFLAMEELNGYSAGQSWLQSKHTSAKNAAWGSVYVPEGLLGNVDRIFKYELSYCKGALLLHMIRWELNDDDIFFEVMHDFQEQYADSSATAMDFKEVLEQVSGDDYTMFFNQWFYGFGHPIFDITWFSDADSLYLTSTQTTADPGTTFFRLTLPVHVNFEDGSDTTFRVLQETNLQSFAFSIDQPVFDIQIDPDQWILYELSSLLIVAEELDSPIYFTLGPNPASDKLNLFFSDLVNKSAEVFITDLSGRVVMTRSMETKETALDIGSLSPGIYLVRISDGENRLTRKFVKR